MDTKTKGQQEAACAELFEFVFKTTIALQDSPNIQQILKSLVVVKILELFEMDIETANSMADDIAKNGEFAVNVDLGLPSERRH
jgi:hypothetical protein